MIKKTLHRLALLFMLAFALTGTQAQGWEKKYSPDLMMGINSLYQMPNGNYMVAGWNLSGTRQRLMHIQNNGDVLAAFDQDSLQSISFSNITQDGGMVILGNGIADSGSFMNHRRLVRLNAAGQQVWAKTIYSFYAPPGQGTLGSMDIDTTGNGGFICLLNPFDTAAGFNKVMVQRLDGNGNLLWQQTFFDNDSSANKYGSRITNSSDGGFLLTVLSQGIPHLVKIDGNGNQLWDYTTPVTIASLSARIARDGNILLSGGYWIGGNSNLPAGFIGKLNQNGTQLWLNQLPLLQDSLSFDEKLVEEPGNVYTFIGVKNGGNSRFKFGFLRIDSAGNILLQRRIPVTNFGPAAQLLTTTGKTFIHTTEGGYLFGGWLQYDPQNYSAFLIKMDSSGQVYPSQLSGQTFYDVNANCTRTAGEQLLKGNYLTFTSAADTFTVLTNDSGYYSLGLQNTSYTVAITAVSPFWQGVACNAAQVNLSAGADSIIDFGLQPVSNQPYLVMDAYTRERACTQSQYTLHYCNTGTVPFTGVVSVQMDTTVLQYDSASAPLLSHNGNTFYFQAGPMGINECSTLIIYYKVPCDVNQIGTTNCFTAHIIPDTIYNPSPQWDKANLLAQAVCNTATDSVELTITNTGTGNMGGPQFMIVIEDNVIMIRQPIQLASLQQVKFKFKANGATYRITASQTPHHPLSAFTTAAVEACGTNQQGGFSKGFINQFANSGYYAFTNTFCGAIVNSFDPNHKSVLPEGAGAAHLVDSNTVLQYTIEFQNTGNDTAFVVRVADTLAGYLDPLTVQPGAASHNYQMEIIDNHILLFTFANINLLDSAHNERASNGFVTFTIKQKAGNAGGTVINNDAAIYFDYNPPIITNTATVRIGELTVMDIEPLFDAPQFSIRAFPNPFNDKCTIEVSGALFSEMELAVFDITGRRVKAQKVVNSTGFILSGEGLANGTYLFEISSGNQVLGRGKLAAK